MERWQFRPQNFLISYSIITHDRLIAMNYCLNLAFLIKYVMLCQPYCQFCNYFKKNNGVSVSNVSTFCNKKSPVFKKKNL